MTMAHSISDNSTDRFKEISSWVSSATDLDQHLELVLGTVVQMVHARIVALLLQDREGKSLSLKAATGRIQPDIKKRRVPVGKGIAGYVAEKGEPAAVPDVQQDPRWDDEPRRFAGFDVRSVAYAPIRDLLFKGF